MLLTLVSACCCSAHVLGRHLSLTARTRTIFPRMCDAATAFDAQAWQHAACWEDLNSFERSSLLRGLLDGDLSQQEANHAAWRGIGYVLAADGSLCDPEGAPPLELPNVLADDVWLERLRAQLPLGDSMEDEDELAALDVLVESLHGETLTRTLIDKGDRDFLARRTLVQWLYLTQPALGLK